MRDFDIGDLGEDIRECSACASICAPMGVLGRTTHYRCPCCGIEWSESAAAPSLRGDNLVASEV